ncbi:helix-turn-helix domain-containing protein [Cryobacterium sp. RTC2.1]|uniref:ArsR/SmtB family transcription factor n=1 Tax=Cryobacterium sp. RTC2.1 TaxID=3048634 RepID=UPI002B23E07B|nr:helix-turn-helix domain-containing protein [Cryobacterium sp. RTC2.1]MEB0003501.1 helix-turn-helix domain-containing protein [Cryobacterium sp. RTC2.1]
MFEERQDGPEVKPSVISLTGAKQMRALAHPLRLQILGELRVGGPRTVGLLSEVFDEAPGTLSYHLGKLAEFGFVEEVPELASDKRERWWRASHDFTDISPAGTGSPPSVRRASEAMRHQIVDVYAATLHRVVEVADGLPDEWANAATSGDTVAYLTADELAQASAELNAVAEKWHALHERDHANTEAVQIMVHVFRRP